MTRCLRLHPLLPLLLPPPPAHLHHRSILPHQPLWLGQLKCLLSALRHQSPLQYARLEPFLPLSGPLRRQSLRTSLATGPRTACGVHQLSNMTPSTCNSITYTVL